MNKANIKRLYKCVNNIIDIFINSAKAQISNKDCKDLIIQLDKLTSLVIKLNQINHKPELESEQIAEQDEVIMKELLKIYSKHADEKQVS